jgi:hypothetical protein
MLPVLPGAGMRHHDGLAARAAPPKTGYARSNRCHGHVYGVHGKPGRTMFSPLDWRHAHYWK